MSKVHPVDRQVGRRIRTARQARGISQRRMAQLVGLSVGQIQKYENGTSRISAGTLYDFAGALGVGLAFFFAGVEEEGTWVPEGEVSVAYVDMAIMRGLGQIADPKMKHLLLELIRSVSAVRRHDPADPSLSLII